jgi:hypothetical protein
MMTSEQRARLLGQVATGVELETATEALGISGLDLQMGLLCDEEFDIALALAQGMRTEFAKALFEELIADQGRGGGATMPLGGVL